MAEAPPIRFSPNRSAPGSSGEGPERGCQSITDFPVLADRVWFSDIMSLLVGQPICCLRQGRDFSPSARAVDTVGLAPEGAQYLKAGLLPEVIETMLSSRAPSTRRLYGLKWNVFSRWCGERGLDPVNCPVASVLEFVQDHLSAGLTPSTLKVYVAAIAAFHAPLDVGPLGRHQLVVHFLRGAWRMRTCSRVPTWDLAVVLEGLSLASFEPIKSATVKNLTFKMVFLLAITSLKRVGDLQALAISPNCLEFAPGRLNAILHPMPGYVPKVPSNMSQPVVLQTFHRPAHVSAEEEKLHLLCPVRALNIFNQKSSHWRRSEQLLVCFGSPKKGLPASKQTISN